MVNLRVALAQTCPINAEVGSDNISDPFSTIEQNLLDVKERVKIASEEGAEVVVFPEYFLQGLVDQGRQYLCYSSRHLITYLNHLAREFNISIVGTIVHADTQGLPDKSPFAHLYTSAERETEAWSNFVRDHPVTNHSPKLRNVAFYIEGSTGKVVDEYAKRNLWHPERDYLTPGDAGHQVFDTRWGKCAFLICWDVSHPAASQALNGLGVDIVFAPTYWIGYDSAPTILEHHDNPPQYETETLAALSYARAFETETVWILCNAGGPVEEGYIGGSGIWMPLKGKVGGCKTVGVELAVVDVDLEVLKPARRLYKIKVDNDARMQV